MLTLIKTVFIILDSHSTDYSHVVLVAKKMGIKTKVINSNEKKTVYGQPLIYCGTSDNQNNDNDIEFNGQYVLWNSEHVDRGIFFDSTCRPGGIELTLIDSLYAMFQSYIRRNELQPPEFKRLLNNSIIGCSQEFQNTINLTCKVAKIDCDVLIQGETGTGKEVIARLVHYQSEREGYPFVPVNCGAFSDELLLSELFGHSKGAFTGAISDRVGLIEQAQDGTLFLDEINSLSEKAQVALLRYLQDREVRPQGSNKLKVCNTRVVAASNQSLAELVAQGKFREDLLFRLDVLHVDLPPLRQRGSDVHLLIQHFMSKIAEKYGQPPKILSSNLVKTMQVYEWPGNIRQLQNIVTRLFLLSDQTIIRISNASKLAGVDWAKYLETTENKCLISGMQSEKKRVVEAFERSYLKDVLSATKGNVSKAAKISNKERSSFIRLMQKYKLNRNDFVIN